jgi:hypothetical protein
VPTVDYLHLPSGSPPPASEQTKPYRAVVVVEQILSPDWRNAVSDWLVQSGCCYMMAWGQSCADWDDSVDWASLVKHDYDIKSDDDLIMTTWHEDDSLDEVFWFAKTSAEHPTIKVDRTLIIDINESTRRDLMIDRFQKATHD